MIPSTNPATIVLATIKDVLPSAFKDTIDKVTDVFITIAEMKGSLALALVFKKFALVAIPILPRIHTGTMTSIVIKGTFVNCKDGETIDSTENHESQNP